MRSERFLPVFAFKLRVRPQATVAVTVTQYLRCTSLHIKINGLISFPLLSFIGFGSDGRCRLYPLGGTFGILLSPSAAQSDVSRGCRRALELEADGRWGFWCWMCLCTVSLLPRS